MTNLLHDIFSSLKIRNFRLYFSAQVISLSGTWMQAIALSWLAYDLTGSSVSLGITLSLQYIPLLLFGIFGGYLVDQLPKYKTLFITQFLYSVVPFIVAILIFTGGVSIWWLYAASLWQGIIRIIDNPLRQAFLSHVVSRDQLKNAISLYSTCSNLARILGPLLAGFVLATYGAGWCFLLNAISFYAVLINLYQMDQSKFYLDYSEKGGRTLKLLEELSYVWKNKIVRDTLFIGAFFGSFIMTFQTIFPIFAKTVFDKGVGGYSVIMSFYGLGAVCGGLFAAQDKNVHKSKLRFLSILLGISYTLLAATDNYHFFLFFAFVLGIFTIQFSSSANTLIRLKSEDKYIGMVSALWTIAMIGMTAVGSFLLGAASDIFGIRIAVFLGGLIFLAPVIFYYHGGNNYETI